MQDNKNQYVRLEAMMNYLADSVLESPNDAIVAEVKETGVDPNQEAERVRCMLREKLKTLEAVHARISHFGHRINAKYWWSDERGFHNNCLDCGSLVSFAIGINDMQGSAFDQPCSESGSYRLHKVSGNGNR